MFDSYERKKRREEALEKDIKEYRERKVKCHFVGGYTFNRFHYEYMFADESTKRAGVIAALVMIAVLTVTALFTGVFIADTAVCAFCFGAYYCRVGLLHRCYRGAVTGKQLVPWFSLETRNLLSMFFRAQFFEVYMPFALMCANMDIRIRFLAALGFILFTLLYRMMNNFMENSRLGITLNNIFPQFLTLFLGAVVSLQAKWEVRETSFLLLVICIVAGFAVNRLDGSVIRRKKGDGISSSDIYNVSGIFDIAVKGNEYGTTETDLEFSRALKSLKEKEEQQEKDKMEEARLAKMTPEEIRREREAMIKRGKIPKPPYTDVERCLIALKREEISWLEQRERDKRYEEMAKKQEEKAREAKLQRRLDMGEELSKEERTEAKKIETKNSSFKINQSSRMDRSSMKR